DIPVMPGTARRARPAPRAQVEPGEQIPASRAGLGGRVPAADHDQLAPVPLALILKLATELAPPATGDRTGQPPVADHVLDGEILDHDDIRRADQASAGPVQEVAPRVADLAVGAGDLSRRPGPVPAAFLAAGQAPLVAG